MPDSDRVHDLDLELGLRDYVIIGKRITADEVIAAARRELDDYDDVSDQQQIAEDLMRNWELFDWCFDAAERARWLCKPEEARHA